MAFATKTNEIATIPAPNIVRTTIRIKGTAPLVMHRFSAKAKAMMMEAMSKTKAEKKTKAQRPPRDYDSEFLEAQHVSTEGWVGIPSPAFRAAMIDACRTVGLMMTRAKMSVFVIPDGLEKEDGTPLVRLYSKEGPQKHEGLVRLETGVADVRIRPMWREWAADVTIEYDADMITGESVIHLLDRAGRQVGLLEGRPFSKHSVGQGWGTFTIDSDHKSGDRSARRTAGDPS